MKKQNKLFNLSDSEKIALSRETKVDVAEIERIAEQLENESARIVESRQMSERELRKYLDTPITKSDNRWIPFGD